MTAGCVHDGPRRARAMAVRHGLLADADALREEGFGPRPLEGRGIADGKGRMRSILGPSGAAWRKTSPRNAAPSRSCAPDPGSDVRVR